MAGPQWGYREPGIFDVLREEAAKRAKHDRERQQAAEDARENGDGDTPEPERRDRGES